MSKAVEGWVAVAVSDSFSDISNMHFPLKTQILKITSFSCNCKFL
jgi:hypothetical protein